MKYYSFISKFLHIAGSKNDKFCSIFQVERKIPSTLIFKRKNSYITSEKNQSFLKIRFLETFKKYTPRSLMLISTMKLHYIEWDTTKFENSLLNSMKTLFCSIFYIFRYTTSYELQLRYFFKNHGRELDKFKHPRSIRPSNILATSPILGWFLVSKYCLNWHIISTKIYSTTSNTKRLQLSWRTFDNLSLMLFEQQYHRYVCHREVGDSGDSWRLYRRREQGRSMHSATNGSSNSWLVP